MHAVIGGQQRLVHLDDCGLDARHVRGRFDVNARGWSQRLLTIGGPLMSRERTAPTAAPPRVGSSSRSAPTGDRIDCHRDKRRRTARLRLRLSAADRDRSHDRLRERKHPIDGAACSSCRVVGYGDFVDKISHAPVELAQRDRLHVFAHGVLFERYEGLCRRQFL